MKHKLLLGLALVLSGVKKLKRGSFLVTLFVAMASIPLSIHAKSVDFLAHFDREDYWNSHAIYLARITDIKKPVTNGAPYVTSFNPVKIISGTVDMTNRSIESYPGQIMDFTGPTGEQPLEFPLGVSPGSEMLVSEAANYHQITVVRVMQFPEDQALLVVLERIADLRKAPTLPALLAGAASAFDLEAGYCLNRLLTMPDQTIPNAALKKLQSLADDNERSASLRMAADDAALKFSGIPESDRDDAEYHWLRGIVQTASQSTNSSTDFTGYFDEMRPLIYKMFEFKNERDETTDYILGLVSDQKVPAGLRDAACSALSGWDQNVFNFQNPDKRFDRMFNTYVGLLTDKNPDLRITGMAMLFDRTLHIMANQSPPASTEAYNQKAVQALQKAMAVETNSRVMLYFKSRMEIYNDEQQHPQTWNQMRALEINSSGTNGH